MRTRTTYFRKRIINKLSIRDSVNYSLSKIRDILKEDNFSGYVTIKVRFFNKDDKLIITVKNYTLNLNDRNEYKPFLNYLIQECFNKTDLKIQKMIFYYKEASETEYKDFINKFFFNNK